MKKNHHILYAILFGILMLFLFSFMIQEHFKPFETKELRGYYQKPKKPTVSWKSYKSGLLQQKTEHYITNYFGFREPIIRLYHQICWDLFGKEFVSYIHSGKQGWLYYGHNIRDYYGTEMYDWFADTTAARQTYEKEVRLLNKVKGILEQYDVTLLTFIAPSKGVVYPEFLPNQERDTTSLNARVYYARRFAETGIPCFEMNPYFLQMKDTCRFCLFPPTGDHWNFSCVYATDSLLRFMEPLRGIHLPHVEYGDEYLTECSIGEDRNRDLEGELNLLRPIRVNPKYASLEREYHVVCDTNTTKPAVLFIGNSFLQRSIAYLPPEELFSDFQFWYYNRVAYQGADQVIDSVKDLQRLDYLLDADYIVFFSSASQMYRATEGFAEDAILQLCVGEERFRQRKQQVIDSLFHDQATHNRIAWKYPDSLYLVKLQTYTEEQLRKEPETYFPELAGDDVPTARNPLLLTDEYWAQRDLRRQIKADPNWLLAVSSAMATDNLSLQQAINLEVSNIRQGLPSLQNKDVSPEEYKEILIKQMEKKIYNDPEWFKGLKKIAEEKGYDLDNWIHRNAVYMINTQIQEGKIKLPEKKESNDLNP